MTDTATITEGEGYAWAVPVVDEAGEPKTITGGTPSASAKREAVGVASVSAVATLGNATTIHASFAPGDLSEGLHRVQTWLTLDGEPQMLDEFKLKVRAANG